MAIIALADIQAVKPNVDVNLANAYIADAIALAGSVASCLSDPDLDAVKAAAAKAVLRQVIMRWIDRGSGITSSQTTGPFSWSLDTAHGGLFWPSEIEALQGICRGNTVAGQKAGYLDAAPPDPYADTSDVL